MGPVMHYTFQNLARSILKFKVYVGSGASYYHYDGLLLSGGSTQGLGLSIGVADIICMQPTPREE